MQLTRQHILFFFLALCSKDAIMGRLHWEGEDVVLFFYSW